MANPLDYRVGNIVDYMGPLGQKNYAHILELEDDDKYDLKFTFGKPYHSGGNFVGYKDHVTPVILEPKHLLKLGFELDPNDKRYRLEDLVIGPFRHLEGANTMQMNLIDLGYRVMEPGFIPEMTKKQEIEYKTTGVYYLHSLQNFCSDHGYGYFEFDVFN